MDKKDDFMLFCLRLANRGAKAAQAEARRLGVPNVYFINGKPVYEMPNGELALEYDYKVPSSKENNSDGRER